MASVHKPRIRIKRNTSGAVPAGISGGELAVDLFNTKLYVGNTFGNSIPIAAQVTDNTNLSTNSDNKIVTEKAAKAYTDVKLPIGASSAKGIFVATRSARTGEYAFGAHNLIDLIDFSQITIENNSTSINVESYYGFQYALVQQTANNMYLNVSYSIYYSSIDGGSSSSAVVIEGTNLGYYRSVGLRVTNSVLGEGAISNYYAMQTIPPIIGTATTAAQVPFPTLITGSATLKLPKFIPGSPSSEWGLQLVRQFRSADGSMVIGAAPAYGVIDPYLSEGYSIRIQIVKIAED